MSPYSYQVGDLVCHKLYRYRGVIAGRDSECQADDIWYQSNRSQPDREQPWYHVLVHGGSHTTYVAEENLSTDDGGEQVVHPLTRRFFTHFSREGYACREGVEFPDLWSQDGL